MKFKLRSLEITIFLVAMFVYIKIVLKEIIRLHVLEKFGQNLFADSIFVLVNIFIMIAIFIAAKFFAKKIFLKNNH